MSEIWLPVVDYERRYSVSSLGRIRSTITGKILKPTKNYAGYHVVSLYPDKRQHRVHVLVLTAFVGPRPSPLHDGCHEKDNKDDNRLCKLRWDTKAGNAADRRPYDGEKNPNAKLNDGQRAEIKRRRLAGEKTIPLAKEFGITPTRVSQIALNT